MSIRSYVLLDIVDSSCEYAVQMLHSTEEAVLVDWLEGHPNVMVMLEAPSRQRLAEALMKVLGCIDGITDDLRLLMTRDDGFSPGFRSRVIHVQGRQKSAFRKKVETNTNLKKWQDNA